MIPSRLHALLAVFGCGCAAPPPPVPAPPAPVSVAAPPPRTVSIAPPPSPAPKAASAPVDPAADRDKLALAEQICPAAIKHVDGKVLVGCRACPPFSGDAGRPDGTVAVDPSDFWPLELRYPGAFTKPGASEFAAVFQGCEAHSDNYGGTLLIEKTASGYRKGPYFSGVHPDSCQPYRRPDGRDLLVCQWSDAHQLSGFTRLFVYDFAQSEPDDVAKGWKDLVDVRDTSSAVCMYIDPTLGVYQGRVLGFHFEDRNKDGRLDLVVDIEHRHTVPSAALTAKVDKACKKAPPTSDEYPSIDVASLLGAPVKDTLELLFDGQSFRPTPKTERTLKSL